MEDRFDRLTDIAANVRLSEAERSAMRERLSLLVQAMPVRNAADVRQESAKGRLRDMLRLPSLTLLRTHAMPVFVLVLAVMLTGGGAYAAEQSLPGDPLYAVKLHVNEEVRAALTVSSEAKAKWEAERATRRLEEVELLAAEGKLDAEVATAVETRFKAQAEKAQARVEKMKEKGDDAAAAEAGSVLEGSLRAHEEILVELGKTHNGKLLSLTAAVGNAGKTAMEVRIRAEAGIGEKSPEHRKSAAERRRKAAEHKIAEVRRFLAKWEERLSEPDAAIEANAALSTAEATLAAGDAHFEAAAYGEAFASYQKAHREAQHAKLLLIAGADLKIRFGDDDAKDDDDDADGAEEDAAATADDDDEKASDENDDATDEDDEDDASDDEDADDNIDDADEQDNDEDNDEDDDDADRRGRIDARIDTEIKVRAEENVRFWDRLRF